MITGLSLKHWAVPLCYSKQVYNKEAGVLQLSKELYFSVKDTTFYQTRGTNTETVALQGMYYGLSL